MLQNNPDSDFSVAMEIAPLYRGMPLWNWCLLALLLESQSVHEVRSLEETGPSEWGEGIDHAHLLAA